MTSTEVVPMPDEVVARKGVERNDPLHRLTRRSWPGVQEHPTFKRKLLDPWRWVAWSLGGGVLWDGGFWRTANARDTRGKGWSSYCACNNL